MIYLPLPVGAWDFGLARRVRPSRPASACSFSTLRLNLVLTRGIPPDFRGGAHLFIPPYAIGSVPSLSVHAIAYRCRSPPRVRLHRATSSPQGIVPVAGAASAGQYGPINVRLSFLTPTIGMQWECCVIQKVQYSIGGGNTEPEG